MRPQTSAPRSPRRRPSRSPPLHELAPRAVTPDTVQLSQPADPRTHVAVVHRRYLPLILDATKRIECRLSRTRAAPFLAVRPGDIILFKPTGSPIAAAADARHVAFFHLQQPDDIAALRARFGTLIAAPAPFFEQRRSARYATLIWLDRPRPITDAAAPVLGPLFGRAWLVLPDSPAVNHAAPRR